VGRLYPIKDPVLLLRAVGRLVAEGLDVEVDFAGVGPLDGALVQLAAELGMPDRLHLTGRVEDVPGFLAKLDIFVLPSELEAHPNALLEAMAAGLPCIATEVGGVPEISDHGQACWMIPAKDEAGLAARIRELARDSARREALGRSARARVLAHYPESAMLDAYEALYRDPAGFRPGAPPKEAKKPRSTKGADYRLVRAEPKDTGELQRLLERWVTPVGAVRRQQWLYEKNPQGPAATWFALEPAHGEIVGFTSIFARSFLVEGTSVLGSVGLDAFVRPDHRRRGIVAKLHHATHRAMLERDVPHRFMCGPPVAANLSALVKVGSELVGSAVYMHLPLSFEGLIAMLPLGEVSKSIAARAAHPFEWLARRAWLPLGDPEKHLSIRPVVRADAAFDRLWEDHLPKSGVFGIRDARYVQWRHIENPITRHQVVAIELRDQLVGWAVLEFAARGCLIVDHLFAPDASDAGRALRAVCRYAVKANSQRIAVFTHAAAASNRVFLNHGFIGGRHPSDFQVLIGEAGLRPSLLRGSGWMLRAGDLDPESCRWSVTAAPRAWTDPNYREAPPGAASPDNASRASGAV
jgi:hypothetical protein